MFSTLTEPAIVEVDVNSGGYERAAVLSNPGEGNYLFRREVEVDQGLNTIDVRAEDASGNVSPIKNYELTLPSVAKTYEYDLNGNLRFERDSGGNVLREFRWDAQNRLTHIIEGSNETEFEYDGQDRRRRIIERVNDVEQSNETYLWIGGEIVQKRNSTADTVLRDYYWFGFSEGSNDYFYTRDHLGSVREVIASNGSTIESRYDYDLWGNVTRTAGTGVESDFLYTGHFHHAASDLHLAQYRAYDSGSVAVSSASGALGVGIGISNTYLPLGDTHVYLTAVMDWASRYVISWRLSNSMDEAFCVECLEEALELEDKPEIFNTDQGSQFTGEAFTGVLRAHDIRISMDGKGRALDNVMIERLWRTVKYDDIYVRGYETMAELYQGLSKFIHKYNTRKHQTLGMSPEEKYRGGIEMKDAA